MVILFADATPKTELFLKILSDPSLTDSFNRVAYVKVDFKKDSPDAAKYKVTAAPTLLILDPTQAEPKEIKKITGGGPKSIKTDLDAAIKKLEKK
jgi:hypothetical protein